MEEVIQKGVLSFCKTAFFSMVFAFFGLTFLPAFAITGQVTYFGSNPGGLQMFKHVPAAMPSNAALIVALHGCGQSASGYEAAGWSMLANTYKFYVVYPQKPATSTNNGCFGWYASQNFTRGFGEALSVKQMVDKMKRDYSIDSNKVFVTGFSEGGALTNVLLATYPDVFAAGAPIAGIAYKCANTFTGALACMNPGVDKTPAVWGDLARSGYPGYTGRKPRVAIWHGASDATVNPMNMTETMQQWANYHGVDQVTPVADTVKGYPRKTFRNAVGTSVVETYSITGMGHAVPIDEGNAVEYCGIPATANFVDMNICASYVTARFFGIILDGNSTTTTTTNTTGTFWMTSSSSSTTSTTQAAICITASNSAHVAAGRAYAAGGYAYANGSNQNLGGYNSYTIRTLKQTGTNYFVIGTCS